MFPSVPEIAPSYRAAVVAGEGVFFLSDGGGRIFEGGMYEAIVPRIDGTLSSDELADLVAEGWTAAEVFHALTTMAGAGCIVERGSRAEDPEDAPAAVACPPGCSVLTAASSVPAEDIASIVPEALSTGDLVLVALDDYLLPGSASFIQELLCRGKRVLPFKPAGDAAWIGPLLLPGGSPCFVCLRHRLLLNRPLDRIVLSSTGTLPPPKLCSRSVLSRVLRIALDEAGAGEREPSLLEVDLSSGRTVRHPVVARPQCAVCGAPAAASPKPVILQSRLKVFTGDGGQRSENPEATLERFRRHVSPLTGIVRELRRLEGLGESIEVFVSGQNRVFTSLKGENRRHLRSMSAGKGKTASQAEAGAVCEAIERYSGMFSGEEHTIRGRLCDFSGDAIHPNDCMLFSDLQFRERGERNRRNGTFHRIPEPFDSDAPTLWAPAWSMNNGCFRYLPAAYLYFHSEALDDPSINACFPDSNGNAAGNCLEEAILQGFFELVERDAVALWWYNRLRVPGVDLDSFDDRYLQRITDRYASLGRETWALDLTSDFGIPVFAAVSRRTGQGSEDILLGFGCHLDATVALVRAFCEMNQFLPKALSRNCSGAKWDQDIAAWFEGARVGAETYLAGADGVPLSTPGKYSRLPRNEDLRDDLLLCTGMVAKQGMEMLVLDQTRRDVGMPVVKVLVPGMRHFWGRFAPGRLYDVPVRTGLLQEATPEGELNPWLMFV